MLIDEGHRFVFETMGTVASLSVSSPLDARTRDALHRLFEEYETRFSLYRPQSEASLVQRGELPVQQASPQFQNAYAMAMHWRASTGGTFEPTPGHSGVDLTGLVKGLAIDAGGEVLDQAVPGGWCLNVGGDLLTRGVAPDGKAWTAGIVDPANASSLISQFELRGRRRSMATSGTSERGEHIWRRDRSLCQVTVVANDIVTADVLATAILAGGADALGQTPPRHDIDLLAVGTDGRRYATAGFARPTDPLAWSFLRWRDAGQVSLET